MIYHVAKNRNQWVCGDPTGYLWWQRAHHLVVTTLTLFALADTALYIYAQVLLWGQIDVSQLNPKVLKAANSYGQVHITYTTLYLVVTIEILVWAIYVAWKAWQQNLRSRVSHPSNARRKTPEQQEEKNGTETYEIYPDNNLRHHPNLTISHSPFCNHPRSCSPLHLRIAQRGKMDRRTRISTLGVSIRCSLHGPGTNSVLQRLAARLQIRKPR